MKIRKVQFANSDGFNLGAQIDFPDGEEAHIFALFAHCFTCTKDLKAIVNISKALTGAGISVLRFDFTGLGESEGDFADTNLTTNVSDLVEAARYLEKHYEAPRLLIGHSLGGAAVIQAAGRIPSAVAVATIAAPSDPGHVERALASTKVEVERAGEAEVVLAGRKFRLKKQFFDDLEKANMERAIAGLGRALLILHSPLDEIVGIDNAAEIFKAARHPKSFVSLDKADHLLKDERDSRYAGSLIAAWAARYIRDEG